MQISSYIHGYIIYCFFFLAGSDIIETCTHDASVDGYKSFYNCSDGLALELIRKAGQLALRAKDAYEAEMPSLYELSVRSMYFFSLNYCLFLI